MVKIVTEVNHGVQQKKEGRSCPVPVPAGRTLYSVQEQLQFLGAQAEAGALARWPPESAPF